MSSRTLIFIALKNFSSVFKLPTQNLTVLLRAQLHNDRERLGCNQETICPLRCYININLLVLQMASGGRIRSGPNIKCPDDFRNVDILKYVTVQFS